MDSERPAVARRAGRRSRSNALTALAFVVAACSPQIAHAEPSAADKETARSLMARGREQLEQSELKAALDSFQAADAIMHVPSTSFAVARTEAQLGMLVEARDVTLRILNLPAASNEPAPFVEARAKAFALSEDLDRRIPAIQIELKHLPVGGVAIVSVDGTPLPPAALSVPRKLNPGHHVITARTANAEGRTELDVRERDLKVVDVDLVGASSGTGSHDERERSGGREENPAAGRDGAKRLPIVAVSAFAVGGVGLLVGTITGLLSSSKTSSLKEQCPAGNCPAETYDAPAFQDDLSSAKTLGTVSTISFIVGGVGVAAGVVALFLPSAGAAAASTTRANAKTDGVSMERERPRVTPYVGVGSAGLVGTF